MLNLNAIGDAPCVADATLIPRGSVVRRVGGTNYVPVVDLADPAHDPIGIALADIQPFSSGFIRSLSSPAPCFVRTNDVTGFGQPLYLAYPAGTTTTMRIGAPAAPDKLVAYSISGGPAGGVVLSRPTFGIVPAEDAGSFFFVNTEPDQIDAGSVLAYSSGVPSFPDCVRAELFGGTREQVCGVSLFDVPPGGSGVALSFASSRTVEVRLGAAVSVVPGSCLFLGPVAGGQGTVITNPGVGAAGFGYGLGYSLVTAGPGGVALSRLSYFRTRGA